MPLTAAQLLYTNVEKDRSPIERSGYQTLFYSRAALAEAEVDAVEMRLLYIHGAGNPGKGLFFPLGQDKLVVARIVPLEETDAFGRKGRYLAHALVFDRTEAVAAGLDPFALLQGFPFVTRVDEALAAGDFASGNIAPLALAPEAGAPLGPWPVAAKPFISPPCFMSWPTTTCRTTGPVFIKRQPATPVWRSWMPISGC